MRKLPLKTLLVFILFFAISSFGIAKERREWARKMEKLEQERRVNENWSVGCTVDQVTKLKRCFAATFGQNMAHDGQGYGSKSIPFQIYFLGDYGPFVMVGLHNYPGRHPIVRIDENDPVIVPDDGGVSVPKPDVQLVELLRKGAIVRAR